MGRPSFASDNTDVGAAMLADVENARLAIAQGQQLAAANDLGLGLAHSQQLAGAASPLFPETITAKPPRLSRFAAQVRLESADTALQLGDVGGADQDLAAIQSGATPGPSLASLPLLRAHESLTLAEDAVGGDQPSERADQIATAQSALRSYAGARRADAQALAAEIAKTVAQPGGANAIPRDRLAVWVARIGAWI
ncbi:MAG TPA: hypothetical protein VMU37_05150 [Caulobacteraceae bacterium]|nr:hypothetical protein [Caulobacteraceae bacterium]